MTDALATAFDRIDDFLCVQLAAGGPSIEAVEMLQEAAGVVPRDRAYVAGRAPPLDVPPETLLLWIVVGLFARDASAPPQPPTDADQ
jgi:hypothetical protein